MFRSIHILLVFALFSCQSSNDKELDLYFDLEKKIGEIENDLRVGKARLHKIVELNGKVESIDTVPDTLELQFFSIANINNIQNQNLYEVSTTKDENSNLNILTYRHIDPESAKVPWMEIYYLEELSECLTIKLLFKEQNTGFRTSRNLELQFENLLGKYLLKSYLIKGFQKSFGQDSVKFSIEGQVYYNQ